MKTNIMKNRFYLLAPLLFLTFLLFTSCQEKIEINTFDSSAVITKDSKVISLMRQALQNDFSKSTSYKSDNDDGDDDDDDDSNQQCVEFVYPIAFFVIFPTSQSIETIVINSDADLFAFFDTLTGTSQIRIDFPLTLLGTNGQETIVNDIPELENILQVAVDTCRDIDDNDDDDDDNDYEYCNDDETKVYICHNGNTICVSINAIQAHLDHGDELGQCSDDDDNNHGNDDNDDDDNGNNDDNDNDGN